VRAPLFSDEFLKLAQTGLELMLLRSETPTDDIDNLALLEMCEGAHLHH